MKKILLSLLLFAFVLSLVNVSAEADIGLVKQNDCINLWQVCENCSYVNITSLLYPDKVSTDLINVAMTQAGTDFNYTFCNTSQLGVYVYKTCGNLNGEVICQPVTFTSTPSGVTQHSLFDNPIMIILVAVSLIFIILAFYTKSYPMGFISGIMFTVSGIYTMIYGFNSYTDDFTRAVGLVLIGLGVIFTLVSGYEWIVDTKDNGGYYTTGGDEDVGE